MKSRFPQAALMCMVLVLVTLTSSAQQSTTSPQQPSTSLITWRFLNGSFWFVPEANLKAILTTPNAAPLPINDQTVFHIEKYVDGYFWGVTAVQLTSVAASTPICFQLVGSVTPEGQVNLSFTPTGTKGTRTQGFGSMRFREGSWKMENQMSTGVTGEVTHWAYMTQCNEQEGRCMTDPLPGSSLTLMEFLHSCGDTGN